MRSLLTALTQLQLALRALPVAALITLAAPTGASDNTRANDDASGNTSASGNDSASDADSQEALLWQIHRLESQVVALLDSKSLRLGPIGAALIQLDPQNLAGHLGLQRYYQRVAEYATAERHGQAAAALLAEITGNADGATPRTPWTAPSVAAARLAAMDGGNQIVGQMFTSNSDQSLLLALVVRPLATAPEKHFQRYVDLSAWLDKLAAADATDGGQRSPPASRPSNLPATIISQLMTDGDSAAHTTFGRTLLNRPDRDRAIRHFTIAAASGNLLAHLLLAEVHMLSAADPQTGDPQIHLEQAVAQYTLAMELGSLEARLALASHYLDGRFGEDQRATGITLLAAPVAAKFPAGLRRLAAAWLRGEGVEKSVQRAAALLYRAGELGDRQAQLTLGRLAAARTDLPIEPRALGWLTKRARKDDPEAMVVLANLYGGGHAGRPRTAQARRLYRKAGELSTAPATINEIAWTLAVSDQQQLRDPKRAVDLMERLMNDHPPARKVPAYLDTWATAHAAAGDFQTAIRIQHDAIASAEARNDRAVLRQLQEHLRLFEAGQTIHEELP